MMSNRPQSFVTMAMLALMALFLVAGLAQADPPSTNVDTTLLAPGSEYVNYQGVLTDGAGNPLADGDYTVTFALYDEAEAEEALWTETQTVSTADGLFNVQLGAVTELDLATTDGRDLWLGVNVGDDAEMTPRLPITSVFYARSLVPGAYVQGNLPNAAILSIYNDTFGNNGIGLRVESRGDNAIEAEGDVEVRSGNVEVEDNVEVGEDVVAGRNLLAGNLVFAEGELFSGGDIQAVHDVLADNVRASDVLAEGHVRAGLNVEATRNVEAGFDVIAGGDLIAGGTKPALVQTASFGRRFTYAIEGAQVWFVDQGQAQLKKGVVTINLDPIFLETVTIDEEHPMLVHITLTSDSEGVYVAEQTATSFTVRELQGGTSDATFNWQVNALRKDYEETRLEVYEESE